MIHDIINHMNLDHRTIQTLCGLLRDIENAKREQQISGARIKEIKEELKRKYNIHGKILSRILAELQRPIEEVKRDNEFVENLISKFSEGL